MRLALFTGWFLMCVAWVAADEAGPAPDIAISPEAKAQLSDKPLSPALQVLLAQLDADEFDQRVAAMEELAKLGRRAIPALEQGLTSDSPEVSTRCFEVLAGLHTKGDAEAQLAAKFALERLAKGDSAVASRAKQLLAPKPSPAEAAAFDRAIAGRVRILGARAAIPVIPFPAAEMKAIARRTVSISISNGVKTVTAEEDGRKFKYTEDPEKGIQGELTETKDGKEVVTKFDVKDVEQLKEKHPDIHKLYEQYGAKRRVELR
jgi:hypothetical protein